MSSIRALAQASKRPFVTFAALAMLMPAVAHAKLSDWVGNVGDEVRLILPELILIFGGIGAACVGFGVLSAISAKKNQRPLEYQGWFIGGGTVLIMLVGFIAATSESITGDKAESQLDQITHVESYPLEGEHGQSMDVTYLDVNRFNRVG